MVDFNAFAGWRPAPARAAEVAAVPYDVVDTAEARALVDGLPDSILRVTRPDVDLPDGTSLHEPAAYAAAQAAFARLIEKGVLQKDATPHFYAYAQRMGTHRQVGLMGLASAADYRAGRIKKHEFTRPAKEDDRKRHIEAVRAHLGPVFLAYRASADINARVARLTAGPAVVDFVAPDGIQHQLWPIDDAKDVAALTAAFAALPAFYIADGHHRAAAAARVGEGAGDDDPRSRFLAVAFPDTALRILPYNRVVADRNGHSVEDLRAALDKHFAITPLKAAAEPEARHEFSLYLGGVWHRMTLRPEAAPDEADPVARLDVSVLQSLVLAPLLGVADPRTDERIDFVGGIRGLGELAKRAGADGVAFALYPTSLDELMAIADAGEVMPPKSTWFEPKLRTGMVINRY
ncbi:MAG: DUF1015 domain-containing protein [Myxococcales bacterium]|nr:DUF1015 domain-containing protein [Myxococcales bacterium]